MYKFLLLLILTSCSHYSDKTNQHLSVSTDDSFDLIESRYNVVLGVYVTRISDEKILEHRAQERFK
jgi:hypothetical protein